LGASKQRCCEAPLTLFDLQGRSRTTFLSYESSCGEEERRCEAPLELFGRQARSRAISNMYTVYILRSINHPDRLYIGLTTDLEKRLKCHNADTSTYSRRYSPWELEISIVLKDKKTAEDLEKYLKSGSGFAFLKKRLLPQKQNTVAAKPH
jgi:predicted GIY-YIG superfamily endonuclease